MNRKQIKSIAQTYSFNPHLQNSIKLIFSSMSDGTSLVEAELVEDSSGLFPIT